MQLCIKLLNHLAKFIKILAELSLNSRNKFRHLWRLRGETRIRPTNRCLAARGTNRPTSKKCRQRVYPSTCLRASATYRRKKNQHTAIQQQHNSQQKQHTKSAVSREQKLKMAASVLNKSTRYKLQRVRNQRINPKIERRQTKWQQGKHITRFPKNQDSKKIRRSDYAFLYELHAEDCLTNYLTSNLSNTNNNNTNEQLTNSRTADSENSITKIGTAHHNPRLRQHFWVYFFHNQLQQSPAPKRTASSRIPQVRRPLSLTTIPPAPPTSRTSLRPVNEQRINKNVQGENGKPGEPSSSKVAEKGKAKKEPLKALYIRGAAKAKSEPKMSGSAGVNRDVEKLPYSEHNYSLNLPQPKPEIVALSNTGAVQHTRAGKPVSEKTTFSFRSPQDSRAKKGSVTHAIVVKSKHAISGNSKRGMFKSPVLEVVGRRIHKDPKKPKQETMADAERGNSREPTRIAKELHAKATQLQKSSRSTILSVRARGGADPLDPTMRHVPRRVTLPRESLLARQLNPAAPPETTPAPEEGICCTAGCQMNECPTYQNPETRDQCRQMQPSIITRSDQTSGAGSQNLFELRETILTHPERPREQVRLQSSLVGTIDRVSAESRNMSTLQAAMTENLSEQRRPEWERDRSVGSINRSLMVRVNEPPPMRLSQMPPESPDTPRNSDRTIVREIPSSDQNEREQPLVAVMSNQVIADLQRAPNPQRGILSMQARKLLGMDGLGNAFEEAKPSLDIKQLPTAGTVYSTQYFKPAGSKKSKCLRKHFQLKTPYFPTARYPPVYNVYTTASMLKFQHRNVVSYDEKTLKMVGEPNKPLSPIGAKRTSKRSKTDKEQNTMHCICQTTKNELQKPCTCEDQASEVSCTCTGSPEDHRDRNCSCHAANAQQNLTPRQRRFPPNNRTILRRCITTGGGTGFECQHINQYFKQIKRAIRKGRIVKCGNPYCGQCFQHPKETWGYTINRQFYDKHRCYEEPTPNEECEEEDQCVVQELLDSDKEAVDDDVPEKPPCDYSKCKRQYDSLEERTKRMWGHNRKLEVDSGELNALLKRAYKLRMEQYRGEPCISDSDRLRKLERADRRLHKKFDKFHMKVKTTEHYLCPPEEEEAKEEESSNDTYSLEEEDDASTPIKRCPTPPPKVNPCCSDSDHTKYVRLVSGDVDNILKQHRCERNKSKQQQNRCDIKNWYSPLATVNLCPKISISQIPRSFVIQK